MAYELDPGDLTPALVLTITDTSAIAVGSGVVLVFTDEAGNELFRDAAPAVNASNPQSVVLTHTWVAGQTDTPGTYGVQAFVGGYPYPASGPVTWTVGAVAAAAYCTEQQARDAGATGLQAVVLAAIAAARKRIDLFTGDTFAPTVMEVTATVRGDGTALMPRTVRSVSRVSRVGAGYGTAPLPAASYRVLSSRSLGQVDAVVIGGLGYGNMLIAGAEPYNGGWANLVGNLATGQVEVVGVFGWDEPPPEVTSAAAALAAAITAGAVPSIGQTGPDTDDEGNVVIVTVGSRAPTLAGARTTGDAGADLLLAHLVRSPVRLAG